MWNTLIIGAFIEGVQCKLSQKTTPSTAEVDDDSCEFGIGKKCSNVRNTLTTGAFIEGVQGNT